MNKKIPWDRLTEILNNAREIGSTLLGKKTDTLANSKNYRLRKGFAKHPSLVLILMT